MLGFNKRKNKDFGDIPDYYDGEEIIEQTSLDENSEAEIIETMKNDKPVKEKKKRLKIKKERKEKTPEELFNVDAPSKKVKEKNDYTVIQKDVNNKIVPFSIITVVVMPVFAIIFALLFEQKIETVFEQYCTPVPIIIEHMTLISILLTLLLSYIFISFIKSRFILAIKKGCGTETFLPLSRYCKTTAMMSLIICFGVLAFAGLILVKYNVIIVANVDAVLGFLPVFYRQLFIGCVNAAASGLFIAISTIREKARFVRRLRKEQERLIDEEAEFEERNKIKEIADALRKNTDIENGFNEDYNDEYDTDKDVDAAEIDKTKSRKKIKLPFGKKESIWEDEIEQEDINIPSVDETYNPSTFGIEFEKNEPVNYKSRVRFENDIYEDFDNFNDSVNPELLEKQRRRKRKK